MIRLYIISSILMIYLSSCTCEDDYIPYIDIPLHTRSAFIYDKGEHYKFKIKDSVNTYEADMVVQEAYYNMQKISVYTGIQGCNGAYRYHYKEIYYAKLIDSANKDTLEIAINDNYKDAKDNYVNSDFFYCIIYNGKKVTAQSSYWIEKNLDAKTKSINGIQYFNVYTNKAFQNSLDSVNVFTFNNSHGLLEVNLNNFSLSLLSQ